MTPEPRKYVSRPTIPVPPPEPKPFAPLMNGLRHLAHDVPHLDYEDRTRISEFLKIMGYGT